MSRPVSGPGGADNGDPDPRSRRRIVIDFPRSPVDGRPYAPELGAMVEELRVAFDEGNEAEVLEQLLVDAYVDGMSWATDALATELGPDDGPASSG